jgi:WD40 repeat protein
LVRRSGTARLKSLCLHCRGDGVTGHLTGGDEAEQSCDGRLGRSSGRFALPLTGQKGPVESVAFSPDGRFIASGGGGGGVNGDGTVRLWDAGTGRAVGEPFIGHKKETVWGVAFSPDGRCLASGGGDGTVRLWPGPAAWLDEMCAKLTQNMSRKEWREWVSPDIPYIEICPGLPIPEDNS